MPIRTRPTSGKPQVNGPGDGWEEVPLELHRRHVMMDIVGPTGSGRTRLALTAPGPIGLAHAAEKIDGLVQHARKEKDIKLFNFGSIFRGDPQVVADKAAPIWNKMRDNWYAGVGRFKSLVMDTATDGWQTLRYARFGELNPRGRITNLYGKVNAEWANMFKLPRMNQANIVTIHQEDDEYVNDEATGRKKRSGQKSMGYWADVIVTTGRTDKGIFTATVTKGWYNAEVEGMVLEDEDITFANILSAITGMDAAEWT